MNDTYKFELGYDLYLFLGLNPVKKQIYSNLVVFSQEYFNNINATLPEGHV